MTIEWVDELRRALESEFAGGGAVATFATVDRAGAPHGRTVICRGMDDHGQLWFVSDARSEKNEHVRGEGRSELVFWLRELQTQFRIFGETRIVAVGQDEQLRRAIWRELSDRTRSIFLWPTPGIAVAGDEGYPQAASADVAPPGNFEVLVLKPSHVDQLDLSAFPHRRRRWRGESNWTGVDINP